MARPPAAPLVAIPAYVLRPGRVRGWEDGAAAVPQAYLDAVRRAGLCPVVLTAPTLTPAAELVAPFAGLLLIGGGDIDPSRYGATRHPAVYGIEPDRDDLELDLARAAVAATLPLLAICRGMQVLNVAFGGRLHQHLPDLTAAGDHGTPTGDWTRTRHDVSVLEGTRLADVVEGPTLRGCISVHHQAVDRVAPGLVATAQSADGVIEAVETAADRQGWVLGVQWHPERSAATDPGQQAIFDAFAAAVQARIASGV